METPSNLLRLCAFSVFEWQNLRSSNEPALVCDAFVTVCASEQCEMVCVYIVCERFTRSCCALSKTQYYFLRDIYIYLDYVSYTIVIRVRLIKQYINTVCCSFFALFFFFCWNFQVIWCFIIHRVMLLLHLKFDKKKTNENIKFQLKKKLRLFVRSAHNNSV